ncbi:hypothetical protein ABZP36_006092 [Zizania latifolia]
MERHALHLVLYCRAAPGIDRELLKESLSEVLSHCPAMTSRLTRAAGEGGAKAGQRGFLIFFGSNQQQFYILQRLTELLDKSYALGLSCAHMHNDPTAAVLLFNAWAAAHRGDTSPYPPFVHLPAFAVTAASPRPAPPLVAANVAAISSATFRFPAATMRALLSSVEPAGHHPVRGARRALLAPRRRRRGGGAGADARAGRTSASGCTRRRCRRGITGGSAVHFTSARADLSSGLAGVATALDRRVAGVPEEELWAAVEWLHERQAAGGEPFQMYGPELTCMHGAGPRAPVRRGVPGRGVLEYVLH